MEWIDKKAFGALVDENNIKHEPYGVFWTVCSHLGIPKYIGIDNSNGDIWVEEFDNYLDMKLFLDGELKEPIKVTKWYWDDVLAAIPNGDRDTYLSMSTSDHIKVVQNYKELAISVIESATYEINERLSDAWNSKLFFKGVYDC